MKKRTPIFVILSFWLLTGLGCNLSPTPMPANPTTAPSSLPTGTNALTTSQAPILPTPTSLPNTATPALPSPTTSPILTCSPSGPYAVILVKSGDVLYVRSAPGSISPVIASFPATGTGVMRTGSSAWSGADLWVEVTKPGGGTGWVNSAYLTEAISPAAFCADSRVNTLVSDLGTAFKNSDGQALAALVSPKHGLSVQAWANGPRIIFDQQHAEWVFTSTYEHDWGSAPASGLDVKGSFQSVVLPALLEVFNSSYELHCNEPGYADTFSLEPWPKQYANIGFYNITKPATPGVDLDWRTWLVGVEYVENQPTIFSLIHFAWEP